VDRTRTLIPAHTRAPLRSRPSARSNGPKALATLPRRGVQLQSHRWVLGARTGLVVQALVLVVEVEALMGVEDLNTLLAMLVIVISAALGI